MILRGAFKFEVFVRGVAQHLCPGSNPVKTSDRVWYIGDGYWRARPVFVDGKLFGVDLINPDKSFEDIITVEKAVAILIGCEWDFWSNLVKSLRTSGHNIENAEYIDG